METGEVKASIAYSGDPPLVARIGISVSIGPSWPKAILTALAARPICGARYADRRKAELSEIASSVQRRFEAIEELTNQLRQHLEEANRLAGKVFGQPRTVTRLLVAPSSLITELWAGFDNLARFYLVFLKHIIRKRISGTQAFGEVAKFSGDPVAVTALSGWRHAVLHQGALAPILWGPDVSEGKQSEFELGVPGSKAISFDDLVRCGQLLGKALKALESDLIDHVNRQA